MEMVILKKVKYEDAASMRYFWDEKGDLERCVNFWKWEEDYPDLMDDIKLHQFIINTHEEAITNLINKALENSED